jgi:hypothetical protein
MPITKHPGSCHCGAVKYEVELDLDAGVTRCNCRICTKTAALGTNVKPAAFTLLAGEDRLGTYVWGGRVSTRYFCKECGIHVFARGHLDVLGGDFVSICVNTLDDVDPGLLKIGYWDGRHDNWMAGVRDTPWPIVS